jgi:Rieske 2Fe-2S family protein
MPGRYYTSADVFEQEQERVFLRHWLCAGRAEAIAEPSAYFVRNVGTESAIVVRGRHGEVRAFHNVCRHRGSRICEEPYGRFASNIRCPYHAWTYGLDGALLGAASMDGFPGFDRAEFSLHAVGVAVWEGWVFVNFAADAEPLEQTHAPLIGRFSRFGMPYLRAARRIDYDVRANWKLVFENYSECYHCSAIHPALVKLSPADSGANDLTSGPFLGGYMEVKAAGGSMTESGLACAISVAALPESDMRRVYYYTLFPNMLLSLHPDYVMAHTLWPVAPDRTLIECEWLFHPDAPQHPGFDPDDAVRFWDLTNREDWHACEQSQLGVSSRAHTPGPYSPREGISVAFDEEYRRVMSELR